MDGKKGLSYVCTEMNFITTICGAIELALNCEDSLVRGSEFLGDARSGSEATGQLPGQMTKQGRTFRTNQIQSNSYLLVAVPIKSQFTLSQITVKTPCPNKLIAPPNLSTITINSRNGDLLSATSACDNPILYTMQMVFPSSNTFISSHRRSHSQY